MLKIFFFDTNGTSYIHKFVTIQHFKQYFVLKPAAVFRCVIFHFEQKSIKFLSCTLGYFSREDICLANEYGLFCTHVQSLRFIFATNHLRSLEFCCG